MRVVSVNVGRAALIGSGARERLSGFVKRPVVGPVRLRSGGLEGDEQADRVHHGGPLQSLYAYPHEHYAYWREALGRQDLPPGAFGENLTVDGWRESEARSGDRVRVGTAVVEVTRPRFPCVKLEIIFDRPTMVRDFQRSGRSGFYLKVVEPGELRAGDVVTPIGPRSTGPTIARMFQERVEAEG